MKKICEKFTRKKVMGILICVVFFLAYEFGLKAAPFAYNPKEVESIEVFTGYEDFGSVVIKDKKDIRKVIKILKSINAYRGPYSVDDLEGDTPGAEVTIHLTGEHGYGHGVSFSADILVDDAGNFYKISMSEYNKLYKIKKKYGKNVAADSDT